MPYRWPAETDFATWELDVLDRACSACGRTMYVCDHRHHHIFCLDGPTHLVCKLNHCPDPRCSGHHKTVSPEAEATITMPYWVLGWDVFCWIGHRRFARHWSVPQIRGELLDTYKIPLSSDAIEKYIRRYQTMLAARQQDPERLRQEYRSVESLILSIDGLQPEKGHETLYVVRELTTKRVWFAEALLSATASEVRRLITQAREWAERLGKPVKLWMSDKQDAFVTGIAGEFPAVPHRYCANHFLRDLAKPVLEADSHAKVQMRKQVRGLRSIEKTVLDQRRPGSDDPQVVAPPPAPDAVGDVVLDYCGAVRGILNDDQGGPLDPPGLRMAEALGEVRQSLGRNLGAQKGGRGESLLSRLAGFIDRGLDAVKESQVTIQGQVEEIIQVWAALDPSRGTSDQRRVVFATLGDRLRAVADPIRQQMARVMRSFEPGLFVGGDEPDLPRDNLDLERWFRQPKGHERRIHGHRHAGVRIVQEGPTLLLALDAHLTHPGPFAVEDLHAYREAQPPGHQLESIHRREVMRKARSRKKRGPMLAELERRYLASS